MEIGLYPVNLLSPPSYNCGMNYCRLSCNYSEIMNCEVRIYASNQGSKYSAFTLTAGIHGSGSQYVVLEEPSHSYTE